MDDSHSSHFASQRPRCLNESNNPRLTGLLCKMEETGQGEGPSVRAFRPSFEFPSTTKHWRGWCLTVMFSDITESLAWAHWVTVHWPPPAAGELQLDSACPTPQGFLQDTWEEKDTALLPAASATPCRFRVGDGGCCLAVCFKTSASCYAAGAQNQA